MTKSIFNLRFFVPKNTKIFFYARATGQKEPSSATQNAIKNAREHGKSGREPYFFAILRKNNTVKYPNNTNCVFFI